MSWVRRSWRQFWPWIGLWTAIGLAIRVATVLGYPNRKPGGDPYFYYNGARLLVEGHGFINPYDFNLHHQVVQSASFAPLYTLWLAVPMVVGLKTYFIARLWTCVAGAAAIAVVGLAGREIAGPRVGVIAAALTALYPNMWMPDEIGAAESMVPLLVGLVLLCAYRFWKQPDMKRIVWFGASLGLLILARDELALLILFMFVPLVLMARLAWTRRVTLLAIGGLAAALVLGPWVGYNMSRFDKPTFVSNEAGVTLASADCDQTFSGPLEGYWSFSCAVHAPVSLRGDESDTNAAYEKYALTYLRHHENRLLPVSLAKIGRAFGYFHPMGQIKDDATVETRPYHWALTGLVCYYVLLALSIVGSVVLRRRRVPIFPLWTVGLNVVIAVVIAFGNTRYRIPFEVPLVLMSAVAVDWVWSRFTHDAGETTQDLPAEESPIPAPVGT